MTWRTRYPSSSSVRLRKSQHRYARRFPRCCGRYTVGPQEYIETSGGCCGRNSSTLRVSVLKIESGFTEDKLRDYIAPRSGPTRGRSGRERDQVSQSNQKGPTSQRV